ncbi:MAG TPA: hypothetical protein VK017_04565 [Sphingobacterium sp.]|nr:hypothetical protein [Sphingobacterium sp.]
MKKNLLYTLLLPICVVLMLSCEKRDFIDGQLSPYIAIEDIRMIHKGEDVQLNAQNLLEAKMTAGVVISDHQAGNAPAGMIVIQQWRQGSKLHGISLKIGADASKYSPGDSVLVHIDNKILKRDGYLYIDNVTAADIEVVGRVDNLMRRIITGAAAYQRPNEFESTIVRVIGGEMHPRPTEGETFSGTKQMLSGADTLLIQTTASASHAAMQVPRNVNVTGIFLQAPGTPSRISIWPRYTQDIEDVSDPEIPEELGERPIIITGFCNDPSGGDGNYEYIQLMANTDIDFSEIPFSLVTSNNAGTVLHTAGWATGANRTYKFNITEGSVKKGDIFYVGGTNKRINGANSTSIQEANWIKTIAYHTQIGDGVGNASSNLLANSGNAAGIAVFVGTNVSDKSVPIDVIFYGGTATASVIDVEQGIGYRITNNDHYAQYIQETGELTPFFSMGEGKNDFRFPHHGGVTNTDVGYFFKLGGEFNPTTREWISPRAHTLVHLEKNATLSEIETGEGMTRHIE